MSKKYLLITSDDFGISHSVNQGILKGFTHGLLKSSNFMAAAPWLPEAIRLAKEHDLPMGVHLTLTCEWTNMSCSPITRAPSLSNNLGYFYPSYEELAENTDIKSAFEDIKQEYRTQIQRILDFGVQPTHVETHMTPEHQWEGNETFLPIVQAAKEVAAEFGLIYTYAFEGGKPKYFNDSFTLTHLSYAQMTQRLASYGDGIYHLVCHCALDNEEQNALALPQEPGYSWAAQCRQIDLNIITSLKFKTFLEENNFTLIDIEQLLKLHQR